MFLTAMIIFNFYGMYLKGSLLSNLKSHEQEAVWSLAVRLSPLSKHLMCQEDWNATLVQFL